MTQTGALDQTTPVTGVLQPGLDALLTASLRDGPDDVLFRDGESSLTARAIADHVAFLADHFRQCGLRPGERVLLVMAASARSLVALIAALRAGLEPALVPCGVGPVDIAAHAKASNAVALVGLTDYGSLALGDAYLSAAALSDTIRLVATLGPRSVDGAADLSFQGLAASPHPMTARSGLPSDAPSETPLIITFEGPTNAPAPVSHRQAFLFAAALALVDKAGINPARAILSTLVPATLAGLVAGPFAALIGASSLALHGPFEAAGFFAAYDADRGAHLVVPAAIASLLLDAGLGVGDDALILLSRFASPTAFLLPPALDCERPVVDLYAFGEAAVLARAREGSAAVAPPELYDGSLPGRLGVALNRARSESRFASGGD